MASTPDGSVVDEIYSVEDGPLLPRAQEKIVEENRKLSQPLQDITVTETEAVVQGVHAHVGDMIQIF